MKTCLTILAIVVLAALILGGLWWRREKAGEVDLSGWHDVRENLGPGRDYEITLKELAWPAGQSLESVLTGDTIFDGSGMHPESLARYERRQLGGREYYYIKSGLFEAVLSLNYYLPAEGRVYAFKLVSQGVPDWMSPDFDIEQEAGHLRLKELLSDL